MIHSTTFEEFKQRALKHLREPSADGVLVPVIHEILADMETPVSVYSRVAANRESCRYSFMLESAEGPAQMARYSFIGYNPFLFYQIEDELHSLQALDPSFSHFARMDAANPLDSLRVLLSRLKTADAPGMPRLLAGAVGYMGYDTVRLAENIPFTVQKDQHMPQAMLGFYNKLIVFDNVRRTLLFVVAPLVKQENDLKDSFKQAQKDIAAMKKLLDEKPGDSFLPAPRDVSWKSNLSREAYEAGVRTAKEYIKAGDIFQVVLSQRFETQYDGDPFHIYRVLRNLNPSPYLFYFDFDDIRIIGSSPELLVRIDRDRVSTRPIAGTRKRGATEAEDLALAQELLADEKERAEHLMLVDLGRNDLGRVCRFGSVVPTRMMEVEHYSHVMHIVSDVQGILDPANDQIDALYATFPAGTLSGAPKIRAMEIIDELEPTERAVYGGAIGYFDFSGNMDWCIGIRTVVINGKRLTIQAGAGIVADSVPEKEFEETENKARALRTAVEWAK